MNAQVADVYPDLMDEMVAAKWELVGHGWFQQSMKAVEDEPATIKRCLDRLRTVDGRPVRAWLGPGLGETDDTVDILAEHGIQFLHDWVIDDLPFWIRTRHGPMVGLPYALELNDVPVYAIKNSSTDELLKRLEATLAVFERETEQNPRVLTFGLHPHIVGTPHVAYWFEKALDLLQAHPQTVFMTSSEIGDWFVEADGTGGAEVAEYTDRLPPLARHMSRDPIHDFAAHAANTRLTDIPASAIAAAKVLILDTLGVGIGGSSGPRAAELRRRGGRDGARGPTRGSGPRGERCLRRRPPWSTPIRRIARNTTASTKGPSPMS